MQFSKQIRETISQGQAEAIRLGNDFIGIEHLLLGLLNGDSGTSSWLRRLNIDLERLRKDAESLVRGKKIRNGIASPLAHSLPLTDQAEKVMIGTVQEAKTRRSSMVDAHDLIIAIVKNGTPLEQLDSVKTAIARR